jgi:hypothetical protein
MITPKQEKDLLLNGYIELPQLAFDGSIEEHIRTVGLNHKTYNSNTSFHNDYLEKHSINVALRDELAELAKSHLGISVDKNDIYSITRIVQSYDGLESYRGHFDSHLFTLVTPVSIPRTNAAESGQLILFPKVRKEPRNELINLVGKLKFKILFANKSGFKRLMRVKNYVELDFANSKPILFLGRQCFHGNRSFLKAPDSSRVTLLTHFFDPNTNGVGSVMRKIRKR